MRSTVFAASGLALSLALAGVVRADDKAPAAPPSPPSDLSTAPAPASSAPASSAPAAAPSDSSAAPASGSLATSIDELQKELSENQDKLTTALHSYELLNDENRQLKDQADKWAAEKADLQSQIEELKRSNSYYQAQNGALSQLDGLRVQLRQTQDQLAALAGENADLRMRVGLSGPGGTGGLGVPTRPGAYSPAPIAAVPLVDSGAKAAAPGGSRVHIVVAGDTLSKISQEYYGTPNRWSEIVAANQGLIEKQGNRILVGMTLVVP